MDPGVTVGELYDWRRSTYAVDVYSIKKMNNRDPNTIKPVCLPIFHCARTMGSLSASKASCRRWVNAVDNMTPVPKCLPMKNTMGGIRRNEIRLESVGKDAAHRETRKTARMVREYVRSSRIVSAVSENVGSGACRNVDGDDDHVDISSWRTKIEYDKSLGQFFGLKLIK